MGNFPPFENPLSSMTIYQLVTSKEHSLVELSVARIIRHGHPHGYPCGYPSKWSQSDDIRMDVHALWPYVYGYPYGYPCGCPCRIIRATDSSTRAQPLDPRPSLCSHSIPFVFRGGQQSMQTSKFELWYGNSKTATMVKLGYCLICIISHDTW